MPSEDAKSVKREAVKAEQEAEDRSLSSILQARKKNPTNAGTLAAKSRPKEGKMKKEDYEDYKDEPIKVKGSSGSRSKPKSEKVKKEVSFSDEEDDDDEPLSKRSVTTKNTRELNKKKKQKEEAKKVSVKTKENGKVKRERKVYDLPGQKRDIPEERDPLRIFYETLYKQVPSSEMAQIWMMESGLLPIDVAKKVNEKKQKKSQIKVTSPLKGVTPARRAQTENVRKSTDASSVSQKKKITGTGTVASKQSKKRKIGDGSSEDDSDRDFLANISTKKHRAS
ncbi:hypothetical protein K2173_027866 [Erythroxylum novogranatense]|uniref:Uncharacterized protein n=1 Tax=Erythroxylum novogranatense TaxID=1862640 RepID=A0AAV8U383_9ROSI|nr:hypothetical protein K2173_027866 [Erythroxylum novogranatense]